MAYDRDRWEPDGDFEDAPVYSEDDDGSARSTRRYLDFAAVPGPSSLWGSLVQSGYHVVYALEIEGIPYLFSERELWTTRGAAAGPRNADDFTVSYALVLDEGTTFSVECDREKGVASGRAVDFILGRQQLADESLGAALFARPTLRANLTSTINDPADDTLGVDNTAGWDATGLLYVGRECVRYTSTTSTSFGGCIRGVAGYPHYHTADTVGGYRQCTDTPVFWRGRLVTVWAHLCGPDGRFLGSRLCDHSEWCRQEWRGYVRDAPRPAAGGMVITALPLVRLAAQEVGAEISGRMLPNWIVSEPSDVVTVTGGSTITIPGRTVGGTSGIVSLASWAQVAAAQASADLAEDVTIKIQGENLHFVFSDTAPFGDVYVLSAHAWFLEPGVYVTPASVAGAGTAADIPLTWSTRNAPLSGAWVVVEMDPSADASEADVGTEGMLLLDGRTGKRLCRYDAVRRTSDRAVMAFRVRGVALDTWLPTPAGAWTGDWNPWRDEVNVRVIGGAAGSWRAAFETILTSSGTGARGSRDTLPVGFGLGLPASWTAARADVAEPIVALTTGRASAADLLCGWLALRRECLVQRRQDDGSIALDVVSTDVVDDLDATALTDADVLMDGHDAPELLEAPNHVRVTSSDLVFETPLIVVRDAVRAQAEGVRALDIKAPGMRRETALELGGEMLLLGDGQAAVRLRLRPGFEVQIGDAVELTSAHPSLWSWSSGAYAPASVLGRVVGWSRAAWSQIQEVTILLAGHAQERINLCPCARVEQVVSTTVFRVEKGGATGFAAGDEVLLYARGDEDGTTYTRTLDAIDTSSDNYDLFTVDSAIAGLSATAELVFTFAAAASVTARQARFLFVRATSEWR